MDIVVWLRSLGLGKYEAAFRENDIDETFLPSLTHENLKELGVGSLGHRVKLLDAIAALRSDANGKTPSVDAATTPSAPSGRDWIDMEILDWLSAGTSVFGLLVYCAGWLYFWEPWRGLITSIAEKRTRR